MAEVRFVGTPSRWRTSPRCIAHRDILSVGDVFDAPGAARDHELASALRPCL